MAGPRDSMLHPKYLGGLIGMVRALATCDGPPDYTYKVAYDEAGALLARLGEPVG